MPENAHAGRRAARQAIGAFFFWTSWAASTDRPGRRTITYTNNWPHEPLVGNPPTGDAVVWTGVSVIMLLAGIGAHGLVVRRAPATRSRTPRLPGSRPAARR